jgi:hypothetical protein
MRYMPRPSWFYRLCLKHPSHTQMSPHHSAPRRHPLMWMTRFTTTQKRRNCSFAFLNWTVDSIWTNKYILLCEYVQFYYIVQSNQMSSSILRGNRSYYQKPEHFFLWLACAVCVLAHYRLTRARNSAAATSSFKTQNEYTGDPLNLFCLWDRCDGVIRIWCWLHEQRRPVRQ